MVSWSSAMIKHKCKAFCAFAISHFTKNKWFYCDKIYLYWSLDSGTFAIYHIMPFIKKKKKISFEKSKTVMEMPKKTSVKHSFPFAPYLFYVYSGTNTLSELPTDHHVASLPNFS